MINGIWWWCAVELTWTLRQNLNRVWYRCIEVEVIVVSWIPEIEVIYRRRLRQNIGTNFYALQALCVVSKIQKANSIFMVLFDILQTLFDLSIRILTIISGNIRQILAHLYYIISKCRHWLYCQSIFVTSVLVPLP